ncbi:MAG: UDP-3-O-(3-hydroxymyristoyl)glucosamine N-acyltransferase [Phycisphaeraceae bacterium]|nr:UDP-3-O-(3-hydroxymyristoyl)glucosamine N-acyltransferase [Phycisphaeraceae bacterium]
MSTHTTGDIARATGGELIGADDKVITGVESLAEAGPDQLSFVRDPGFRDDWNASDAGAALIGPDVDLPEDGRPLIRVDNADLAVAAALELFAPEPPRPEPGIAASATVADSATVDPTARIGPGCVIGPNVTIGGDTVLQGAVTVMADSTIGADCVLWPGVVIRERCHLGDRCILHPNVTVGGDGFGYRPDPETGNLVKIPQIGTARLGDDVELGAGTCVDRGKFSQTLIDDGTKIDNLCQIAHNCRIGRNCVIAALTVIGGSVTVGDNTMIGGQTAIKDQVKIGHQVRLAAVSKVMHDIPDGAEWAGYPATDRRETLRQWAAVRKLPGLAQTVRKWARERD